MGVKLLYITNGITGAGGLERVLSVKASLLAEEYGYDVHILCLNEMGKKGFYQFSPRITFHSITVSGSPVSYLHQYITRIRHKVKQITPDVISVCDDGLKGFFLPKILRNNIPIIYERHVSKLIDNGTTGKNVLPGVKFRLMDYLAKDFDRFIVLTDGNLNEWNSANLMVIANPLSFNPAKKAELKNRKIIAVGKQGYQKAYDLLLKSWSLISDKQDWELHIYGKKDPGAKLDKLAATLGVEDSLHFHEPEKNIQQKYSDSSIFVLSSRFEGFGMVIIEAMACGLPVVSFDCPYGPADILTNGQDGFLVQNGNTVQFAKKLEMLMKDEGLRKQFGTVGKLNAQKYLPHRIVKQWDELFKELTE